MIRRTGSDVAVATETPQLHATKIKRITRMAGAGVLSFSMMGIFALPAYATPEEVDYQAVALSQQVTTASVEEAVQPIEAPSAVLDTEAIERERLLAEEAEAEKAAAELAEQQALAAASRPDLPAGAGAMGIVNGAWAQLGWSQDCTDLVQNALASAGYVTSRIHGGPDLGIGALASFGTPVGLDALAPGDILVWGYEHIAIYVGNGQVVHGGWGPSLFGTMVAGLDRYGMGPSAAYRVG